MAESITLKSCSNDKLGVVHCGVTRKGQVIVAGVLRSIDDGKEIIVERAQVRVTRKGDDYTFTHL